MAAIGGTPERSSDVRPATAADADRLAVALADAFSEDPVWSWLLPRERTRRRRLTLFFGQELRDVVLPRGTAWTADSLQGGCLALPPGAWRVPPRTLLRGAATSARVLGRRLPVALGLLTRMEMRHLREPHHYIAYVGVEAAAQGQGLGTRLMGPTLEECDRSGLPAYLEATSDRNQALYERLGFRVMEELRFAGSPPLRLMRREAQSSASR
jgi:ribosomal protein S18 acetylase RimI-like enzyme